MLCTVMYCNCKMWTCDNLAGRGNSSPNYLAMQVFKYLKSPKELACLKKMTIRY